MAHKVKIWVHEKQNYKQVWGLIEVNWLSGCFIDEYELVGKAKGMVVTTFSIKEIPNERFSYTVKNEHPELPYMSKSEIRKVLCEKYK
uniref:Uncharacterized protein n=2 Tax=Vibrionaceae TaxID=641 RepID=A0A5Q4ZYL7_9GAMM|nr:hypothetical protein AW0309160_04460 [Aliivibrio wodanis]